MWWSAKLSQNAAFSVAFFVKKREQEIGHAYTNYYTTSQSNFGIQKIPGGNGAFFNCRIFQYFVTAKALNSKSIIFQCCKFVVLLYIRIYIQMEILIRYISLKVNWLNLEYLKACKGNRSTQY